MMGRRDDSQVQFLYAFDLDKVVPADHLVRQIDGVLDLSWVHRELAPYYSHTGRPSIDPVLMIRMLLVGYVFALRSERRLCSEVQVNLAYRWFCKLSVEDKIPDHSVFSRARHERFRESDALRRVFEGVVAMCIAAGLVGGEAFSVDASLIKADVDKKKRVPRRSRGDRPVADAQRSHAAHEYLAVAGISITDQMVGYRLPAAGFRELIGEPLCRRMRGYSKPKDTSPAVSHDQQPVQQPERDRRHHEQVHRCNAIRMIAKKGLPAL